MAERETLVGTEMQMAKNRIIIARPGPVPSTTKAGHRNAEMVIKVYSKYIDDAVGIDD